MKKAIKEAPKKKTSLAQRNARPHTAKKSGYKEDVFNAEEQRDYDKTDVAKHNKRNTTGPKS